MFDNPEKADEFKLAKKKHTALYVNYKKLGYDVVIIPKATVEEKIDFILHLLEISRHVTIDKDAFINGREKTQPFKAEMNRAS